MSRYARLDAEILKRLKDGPAHLGAIDGAPPVRAEADSIARSTGRKAFRVIDGRLQALRKAGKIQYDTKAGWALNKGVNMDSKKTEKFDVHALRLRLGMNQTKFWAGVFVTQSGGSRYESGRPMPEPVRELVRLVYELDSRKAADRLSVLRKEGAN